MLICHDWNRLNDLGSFHCAFSLLERNEDCIYFVVEITYLLLDLFTHLLTDRVVCLVNFWIEKLDLGFDCANFIAYFVTLVLYLSVEVWLEILALLSFLFRELFYNCLNLLTLLFKALFQCSALAFDHFSQSADRAFPVIRVIVLGSSYHGYEHVGQVLIFFVLLIKCKAEVTQNLELCLCSVHLFALYFFVEAVAHYCDQHVEHHELRDECSQQEEDLDADLLRMIFIAR